MDCAADTRTTAGSSSLILKRSDGLETPFFCGRLGTLRDPLDGRLGDLSEPLARFVDQRGDQSLELLSQRFPRAQRLLLKVVGGTALGSLSGLLEGLRQLHGALLLKVIQGHLHLLP